MTHSSLSPASTVAGGTPPTSPEVLQQLTARLENYDNSSRAARLARIVWTSQHAIGFAAIAGRAETMAVLEEARHCFTDGHFIATVLLASGFIDQVTTDALEHAGCTKIPQQWEKAIKEARRLGLFTPALLDGADTLRLVRNPMTHRKPAGHKDTLSRRVIDQRQHPLAVLEADAKLAIELMYGYFQHVVRPIDPDALLGDENSQQML